ncbi:carbohydrate kinase [Mucilaginibacter sp. PPCGB 2223]|uniref:FGGY family carbohydrate kinase n=1 Tax=Mucilaginibacter sp. PPCGB 2223 TaxID=1886027 RepID=UPI00082505CA|nr:glycerol kinase GlpK [Mucilaginibacter sp. PPCGB 2223]OCX54393.1 carbohydrate kinase [Mucilaginibacter sp. PPCGB 2223]
MSRYILSIDQGTSGTKCIIADEQGRIVSKFTEPLKTTYLEGGLVEQDPEEIYTHVLAAVKGCTDAFIANGGNIADIKTCGISNQRETFVLWDKQGEPLYNAVVWQCKRSVGVCRELETRGLKPEIKSKTGLLIDPYFSGSKVIWLYQYHTKVKQAIDAGEAYFGTVDTWLLYKLTGGRQYRTDYTNASRTLFFNLESLNWDKELLSQFGLENLNLPNVQASASAFGETDFEGILPSAMPVNAMIGDSHAAAFGEGCFEKGKAKATLGTGCSILINTGDILPDGGEGMVGTICWSTEKEVHYALEGVIVSCGSMVEWVKNEMGLFTDAAQTEAMATAVADNNGVYLVPAFSGLGAPHWDMSRKAEIYGLTFDCNRNHLVRALLETIAFQINEVIADMETKGQVQLKSLSLNGGMTGNRFVLQFLATLLGKQLYHGNKDASAMGAAFLAGLKSGIFSDLQEIGVLIGEKPSITPNIADQYPHQVFEQWQRYVLNSLMN